MRDVSLEEGRLARRRGNKVGVGLGLGPGWDLAWVSGGEQGQSQGAGGR